MFLVRCRDCGSRLLQPLRVAGPIDGSTIVERFCPECERCDLVVAHDHAVRIWLSRDAAIRSSLAVVADRLAATALEVVDSSATGIGRLRPPG